MILASIWERYFLRKFIRTFLLFLGCFYGLYILIDYSSHMSTFAHKIHIPWLEIVRYYLFVFAGKSEILLPIALLIATVHTICTLNAHHELFAFMASGFPLKVLMRPFIIFGLFCVLLMYANEQFLLPEALKKLRRIEDVTKHQKHHNNKALSVHHVLLEDGSLLIFQNYDAIQKRFFDVYWIESFDSIYRIKYLSPNLSTPLGFFVDHLVRAANGELKREETYGELAFPSMKFNPELLQSTILDPDILSISDISRKILEIPSITNEKESKILTAFYWKITIPWLCLLAIMAPIPFCVRFSRHFPFFLIYVCSLFGLIAFYMLMDAFQVIAKRQVISPAWAILGPFFIIFCYFGWRFKKMV